MYGHQIEKLYFRLRALGLVKSKRHYGKVWLGCAQTMMHDMQAMKRLNSVVRRVAVDHLRASLDALASIVPLRVAHELEAVIDEIDRDVRIAAQLMIGR